jgi:hypothetical protein
MITRKQNRTTMSLAFFLSLSFFFSLSDRVLLCSPGWPRTLHLCASASQVLGSQAHTTLPGFAFFFRLFTQLQVPRPPRLFTLLSVGGVWCKAQSLLVSEFVFVQAPQMGGGGKGLKAEGLGLQGVVSSVAE